MIGAHLGASVPVPGFPPHLFIIPG